MIVLKERLFPFSHKPGTTCLIPGTPFEVEAFPALTRIYDRSTSKRKLLKEIKVKIDGPLDHFTVIQDLEHNCVQVFRNHERSSILPTLEVMEGKKVSQPLPSHFEKLSLGMHKKQNWENLHVRCDFREIFPLWLKLGSQIDLPQRKSSSGMFSLLDECHEAIKKNSPEHILKYFKRLFLAGFGGMLVPRLQDTDYQGVIDDCDLNETPLHLLCEGAKLIRMLFVEVHPERIAILPHLPPQFAAGKFVAIDCAPLGKLHIEWTKKSVRRVILESHYDGMLRFQFRSNIKEFRLKRGLREKGSILAAGDSVEIKSGTLYLLDRFQK